MVFDLYRIDFQTPVFAAIFVLQEGAIIQYQLKNQRSPDPRKTKEIQFFKTNYSRSSGSLFIGAVQLMKATGPMDPDKEIK